MKYLLTDADHNPKTAKGHELPYRSLILHLSPHKSSNIPHLNICPMASKGCIASCLNTAGRGGIFKTGETDNAIQKARRERTEFFVQDNKAFMARLANEIARAVKKNVKMNLQTCIRLNGTSDIRWERIPVIYKGIKYDNLMSLFGDVVFYDYTKLPNRNHGLSNYHLTFSRSETNHEMAMVELEAGRNVAVVFRTENIPEYWNGYPVHNGDANDFRFLDPRGFDMGFVIGLKAKGKAKKDATGFVVEA